MIGSRLILASHQSPGDIVMLTAAVRDLHRSSPGQFLTDVRTPCPAVWENNPWITPLDETDPEVKLIGCHYPLIHRSNAEPVHFISAYPHFLSQKLAIPIPVTEFKGDIHISDLEKSWFSQVCEILGQDVPYWIIAAGGKFDFTIKWWETDRYQQVINHFRGKILFVQVGEASHHHPPLRGVLDLRGKTDLRQLVRLVFHSAGILCPVTLLMHLAAAVPTPTGSLRPCVVVAGGREPPHWEAYPGHRFLHTVGALPCCAHGGCWKSRAVPLNDGDEKDRSLCTDLAGILPRCMDMITAPDVIRAIESYHEGGASRYLTPEESHSTPSKLA